MSSISSFVVLCLEVVWISRSGDPKLCFSSSALPSMLGGNRLVLQHFWGEFGSSFVVPKILGAFCGLGPPTSSWCWPRTGGNDLHPHVCVIGLHCRFLVEQGEFGVMFGVPAAPLAQGSEQSSLFPASLRIPGCLCGPWADPGAVASQASLEQPQHR